MCDTRLTEQGECRFHDPESRLEIGPIRADDRVPAPVVGAKQLVGTIEKVDTHQPNPTSNGETDPWDAASVAWSSLKDRLWSAYRQAATDAGPTEEEVRKALSTLAGAWDQVAASFSAALSDPDTRASLKRAAGSFAAALGTTVSGLGDELRGRDEPKAPPTDLGD